MVTFVILALVSVIGALGVVLLRQPIHAALSLVGTLLTMAVLFVTLQAHFLAAIQVIVYAGAIMVLFLFVIMLLNIERQQRDDAQPWLRWAAYAVGLLAAVGLIVGALLDPRQAPDVVVVRETLQGGSPSLIAEVLYGEFMLAFQLVGVLLLTGMVGAVALVQRPRPPRAAPGAQPPSAGALEAGGR